MGKPWFQEWFNQDYLNLYRSHDEEEAKKHVAFIQKALDLKGVETILDLGCGDGRHVRAFEKLGYLCVGIDFSKVLIESAREKSQSRFVQGDLFKAHLGHFDVCLNLFTSFGYFDSDEKNASFFDVVRRHLVDRGQFFMDTLHPEQVKRDLIPLQELQINGEQVIVKKKIVGDLVIKEIVFPGRFYREEVKLYTKETIEKMANDKGLKVIKTYNDYRGNPWKKQGDRQLFVMMKG